MRNPERPGGSFTPAPKLATALLLVLSVNLSGRPIWPSFGIALLTVCLWAGMDGVGPGRLVRRSLGFLPFLFMFVFLGPRGVRFDGTSLIMLAKGSVSAVTLAVLTCSTPFHKLLDGMVQLRFPALMAMILAFMYRYLETLLDEIKRMERARNLRFFGRGYVGQVRVLGYIIGSLFVRSYERGERVYTAMRLRGYDGRTGSGERIRPTRSDLVLLGLSIASLAGTGVGIVWR